MQVCVSFIPGGLVLWLFAHHAMMDGTATAAFLDYFSRVTRNKENVGDKKAFNLDLDMPSVSVTPSNEAARTLIRDCPEYLLLKSTGSAQPVGPTQPNFEPGGMQPSDIPKATRTFLFRKVKLEELKRQISNGAPDSTSKAPTAFTSLAALLWAYTTKARVAAERGANEFAPASSAERPARIFIPVNWEGRLGKWTEGYVGVTTGMFQVTLPISKVLAASRGREDFAALALVDRKISHYIDQINDEWVNKRTNMLAATPDPRELILDTDPRQPGDLSFNSWRRFGADTEWGIPGITSSKPDAIRRVQSGPNISGGIVMPFREESPVWELILNLPPASMKLLCEDEDFMTWVDSVKG